MALYCTACGKPCPTNSGRALWNRHVYGLIAEPRCSQDCAAKPVAHVDTKTTVERMGARLLTLEAEVTALLAQRVALARRMERR